MKSEESTGDEEEDEEADDTFDFHLDHRFLDTTDTMEPRLKKTKQGQQCMLRFKMHFYQKGKPDSRFFCSLGYLFWNTIS